MLFEDGIVKHRRKGNPNAERNRADFEQFLAVLDERAATKRSSRAESPFNSEYLRDALKLAGRLWDTIGAGGNPEAEALEEIAKVLAADTDGAEDRIKNSIEQILAKIKGRPARLGQVILEARAALERKLKKRRVHLGDTGCLTAVEDQGELGSCTANAVIGLVEYLVKAAAHETIDLSRIFLYKESRNLMGVVGDTGSYIRTAIEAMANVGVPPESMWPYIYDLYDVQPSGRLYAYSANFRALTYKRLDGYTFPPEATLEFVLHVLAAGFPVAFGFPLYSSVGRVSEENPVIPLPDDDPSDRLIGGHAVLAVGFDLDIDTGSGRKGALIIKNSWGEAWGDGGFAFMPFEYVTQALALDFWTIFNSAWISSERFKSRQGD